MHNLRNLTNSPYSITLSDGSSAMLPARGELTGVDVHQMHINALRASGYIQVTDVEATTLPEEEPKKRGRPRKD